MPFNPSIEAWDSTLRDFTHKGPNQAGNKSLLSFRSDIGVPGYTGYIPSQHGIVLPVKGFQHTGRPVDTQFKETLTMASVEPEKVKISEYAQEFKKVPLDTKPLSKTGGGYWFSQRKLMDGKPLLASTVYQSEILQSVATADHQLGRTKGLVSTISGYEAARQRAQSADTTLSSNKASLGVTERPATAVTNAGEVVGYQTTYQKMVLHQPLTGGKAAAGYRAPRGTPYAPVVEQRYQTMPRAMPPGLFGQIPTYRMEYGADGSDPMERTAPGEKFQRRMATSRDLAEGTVRNTNHLPGYTGHTPASKFHELARAHADAADERMDAKIDMSLYALDQFSRSRLPHYTGFKPKAPGNITLIQPSQGPTIATTYGAAAHQATKNGLPGLDNTHYNNSTEGTMQFFHNAGEYISDNGLSNAQLYYKTVRPGDGRFKMAIPSKATEYGSRFKATNSLV